MSSPLLADTTSQEQTQVNEEALITPQELDYVRRIQKYALFGWLMAIICNFLFYLVYCSVIRLIFIYPLNDILPQYYNPTSIQTISIFLLELLAFILLILVRVHLIHNHISWRSYLYWFLLHWIAILSFGFLAFLFAAPFSTLLVSTSYVRLKSKINSYILTPPATQSISQPTNNNGHAHLTYNAKDIETEKYFRLIAVHHFLSKLCTYLQTQNIRSKQLKINNHTMYQIIDKNLNKQVFQLSHRNDDGNANMLCHGSAIKNIYNDTIRSTLRKRYVIREIMMKCNIILVNISMIRLLFFNEHVHFYEEYYVLYILYFVKMAIEVLITVHCVVWMYRCERLRKATKNVIQTETYLRVLKSKPFRAMHTWIFDNFVSECHRFYKYWHFKLYGLDTHRILTEYIGNDIATIVTDYLFDDQEYLHENQIDMSDEFKAKIKETLFPDL